MAPEKGLLLVGFGGNARSIADVALAAGFGPLLFVDENAKEGESFAGFPIQKEFTGPLPEGWVAIPASGDNYKRREQVKWIESRGWPLGSVIAPTATLGVQSVIGPGCFLAHRVHVGPNTRLGKACILNTSAVVDHDCRVGDYVHISGRAGASGYCEIGDLVLMGAGAVLVDHIKVVSQVTLGAGAIVTRSIEEPGTYVGVAIRLIKRDSPRL